MLYQQENSHRMQHEDEARRTRAHILEDYSQDEEGDSLEAEFMDESDSSSLSVPNEYIDFDLVYALHTFVATVEGHANAIKGDRLFLMDDSNSHWWLVRVLKTEEVGYIPADNIETPYERLSRLNKRRNVDLAAATLKERELDPIIYRAHQARIASQQYHRSHPSHPSNVRKRSISFRGSFVYHYPPAIWDEEEQLGLEEENYDGYDTGIDYPLNDEENYWVWHEIRAQRQQDYKTRDSRTLYPSPPQYPYNSTLPQQSSNKSLLQQVPNPPLRQRGFRKAIPPSDLHPNNSPGSVSPGGGGNSTASGNVTSAPKLFDLAVLDGNETRKISATPSVAREGGYNKRASGGNNDDSAVGVLFGPMFAQGEAERNHVRDDLEEKNRGPRQKDGGNRILGTSAQGNHTEGGSTHSKSSEREAQATKKHDKVEEEKIWKKGRVFRGLFGVKEKNRTGEKGVGNGKQSEEYYERVGSVSMNEGRPGGGVKTTYSTEPPGKGQGADSAETPGKQVQGIRSRRRARTQQEAYQQLINTVLTNTASQPSPGLRSQNPLLPSPSSSSSLKASPHGANSMKSGTRNTGGATNQSVERVPVSSLKDGSGGTSAMGRGVASVDMGVPGSGSGRQRLGDLGDVGKGITSMKPTEGPYDRIERLPLALRHFNPHVKNRDAAKHLVNNITPRNDAILQGTGGRGPRQRKLGSQDDNPVLPVVVATSDPGEDAEVEKLYVWNNGTSEDREEEPGSTLEALMQTRIPFDLTGQVVVSDYRRPAHGGLAIVYPGLWNDKPVAVKLLKFQKNGGADAYWDDSNARRVRREINVWAALKHPNISEFLGYSTDLADFPAMISRWCQRGTVLEHLKRQALSVNQRMKLAQDVSRGLEYLHQLKVVHGDVKPANILVDDEGLAKLCDFGLVRLVDWEGPAGMTTTSPYTGTERYKAPELFVTAENRRPVATFAGDIYSLGCIMLEFIERIYPFQRFTKTYELRDAIMDGYAPALRSETTRALIDLTISFWNLLEACWGERPDRPSVRVVVDALDNFARTMPGAP